MFVEKPEQQSLVLYEVRHTSEEWHALAALSKHVVQDTRAAPSAWVCLACGSRPAPHCADEWLRSECHPVVLANRVNRTRPYKVCQRIKLGDREVHPSHNLHTFQGDIFCAKCGYYSIRTLRKLAVQCTESLGPRQGFLTAIQNGRRPAAIQHWPLPDRSLAPQT